MRKILLVFLLIFLVFALSDAQELKKEDFIKNAPKDYDKLLEAYKQMVDFAFRWKELYEKEAKSNEELLKKLDLLTLKVEGMQKTIERMDKTIDVLQSIILRFFTPKMGIMGIYNFSEKSLSLGLGVSF